MGEGDGTVPPVSGTAAAAGTQVRNRSAAGRLGSGWSWLLDRWNRLSPTWQRADVALHIEAIEHGGGVIDDSVVRRYLRQRRVDNAWQIIHLIRRRRLVDSSSTTESLLALLATQRAEAAKMTDWRKLAVAKRLQDLDDRRRTAGAAPVELTELRWTCLEIQRLLDDYYDTLHLAHRFQARRLMSAGCVLWASLAVCWWMADRNWIDALDGMPAVLTESRAYAAAGVLGLLGASLSMAMSRMNLQRKPPMLGVAKGNWAVLVARLAVGCCGGILAVAALQSEVLSVSAPAWEGLIAIPGGFSERLVRRFVEAVDPPPKPGAPDLRDPEPVPDEIRTSLRTRNGNGNGDAQPAAAPASIDLRVSDEATVDADGGSPASV